MKYLLIFVLLLPIATANIILNEIMYDPPGSDTDREWIEIYNNGNCTSLNNYKLYEDNTNHGLTLKNGSFTLCNNEYAIIADNADTFQQEYNFTGNLYDSAFSLSNINETISLKSNNTNIIDTITYDSLLGAQGNAKTLCLFNDILRECIQTPGYENQIESNITYNLIINELFPNPQGEDDAPMPSGEFIEIYNPNNFDLDIKGYYLIDNANHQLIISGTNTISGTIIKKNKYLAAYANGFFGLLNNEGLEIIKLFDNNGNLLNEISYGYSEEGLTWSLIKGIWNLRESSPNEENKLEEPQYSSDIKIEKIYLGEDEKAKFGDTIKVKVSVYKGNTSKSAVNLKLNALSKDSSFNIYEKFKNQTLTIPILINPNCDNKFKAGDYDLILTGLGTENKKEIYVSEHNKVFCKEIDYLNFEIITIPNKISETSNTEIKLTNNDNKKHSFKVWSYIIKDRNIVSYDPQDNQKELELPDKSSSLINLENSIEPDTESGIYTLRIKVLKDTRKTPETIDFDIEVDNKMHENQTKNLINNNKLTSYAVYESTGEKAKNIGIYIFAFLLLVVITAIIIKK